MGWQATISRHPLGSAIAFEAAMIPFALGLAWLFGLQPWSGFTVSAGAILLGLALTLPLLAGLCLLIVLAPPWFRQLDDVVRRLVRRLFTGHGLAAVSLVAALAGIGEELLFRGVIQTATVGLGGPWAGVALAAIVFGGVHAVSRPYFVLATLMGVYLGVLYHVTGNLLLPMIAHGVYDAFAIAYLLRTEADRSIEWHA